ncbi:transposase [Streptomyces sp. GMR22]|nr:transposase [Streptomyces sp. GMR22]
MPAPRKYPLELRDRAVHMYRATEPKPATRRMAEELRVHHEALRTWIRQAEADADERDDLLTTAEREELVALRKGTPSSSEPTRSCRRPRLISRPSSTRPGPGDSAHRRAPAPGSRARTPGTEHPLLHPLPLATRRKGAMRTPPPGRRTDEQDPSGPPGLRWDLRLTARAHRPQCVFLIRRQVQFGERGAGPRSARWLRR